VVYTLGHDVVSQWSAGFISSYAPEYDPENGGMSFSNVPTGSHLFLYDGHGSVRSILPRGRYWDIGIDKSFTYDAYGNALGFNPTFAGTVILYRGEQYDIRIGLGYNRRRYVDFRTGTFPTVDPFVGNKQDPQSLHKYAYVHGDPVNGIDPTGMSLASMFSTIGSWGRLQVRNAASALNARRTAIAGITLAQNAFVTAMAATNIARAKFIPDGWVMTIGASGAAHGLAGTLGVGLYGEYSSGKIYGYAFTEAGISPVSAMRNYALQGGLSVTVGLAFGVNSPSDIGGIAFNATFPRAIASYRSFLNPFSAQKMGSLLTIMAQYSAGNWTKNPGTFTLSQSSNFETAVLSAGRKGYTWAATISAATRLVEIVDLDDFFNSAFSHGTLNFGQTSVLTNLINSIKNAR
jgi:RHS repeat-associated protein